MSAETEVLDGKGAKVMVGVRVLADGEPAVVTQVTDPDGDVDDEGRSIGISPQVHVRWDDGVVESYTSYWSASGPWDEDAPFVCDEVEVI